MARAETASARRPAWMALTRVVGITRDAIRAFGKHRTSRMAAALTYYTFFSLFPLLLLLLAIVGYLLEAGLPLAVDASDYLKELTVRYIPQASEVLTNAIESVHTARNTSGLIGILGLLWSASNTFNHMHISLDEIWGFDHRSGIGQTLRRRISSILVVLGLGLLLIASQALKSTTYYLVQLSDRIPGGASIYSLISWVIPIIVSTIAFGFAYRMFPSKQVTWRTVWPGAVMAGVGWELLKWLFAIYAVEIANWQAVYGPIASIIALLTWLYFSFMIVLFGAEFSASFARHLEHMPKTIAIEGAQPDSQPQQIKRLVPVPATAKKSTNGKKRRRLPSFVIGTVAGLLGAIAAVMLSIGFVIRDTVQPIRDEVGMKKEND
ncbi:MAG: YihY/virulence factor BrkB family protein [Chloroflexota bacterium]